MKILRRVARLFGIGRRRPRCTTEARQARKRADKHLQETHERWDRVHRTTSYLIGESGRNHFGEEMHRLFQDRP